MIGRLRQFEQNVKLRKAAKMKPKLWVAAKDSKPAIVAEQTCRGLQPTDDDNVRDAKIFECGFTPRIPE
jgi:hypothetical protein